MNHTLHSILADWPPCSEKRIKLQVSNSGIASLHRGHPWLYAEACRVGLGIPFEERNSVVGIDDSGAGVCSIRLAGAGPKLAA